MPTPPADPAPRPSRSLDVALAFLLATAGGWLAWHVFDVYAPARIGSEQWFQADLSRVWRVLTDRYSPDHERARLHPLFSLVNTTSVYALRAALGLPAETAVRLWLALMAGLLALSSFVTTRLLRFTTLDAALATGAVLASAAFLFWAAVPETKAAGAITILIPVAAAAYHARRPLPDWVLVACCAASLSMTSSNVMAGLALLIVVRPWRRAVQLAANAFVVVAVLQVVQNGIYWYARGMTDLHGESRFLFDPSAGTILSKAVVSLFHAMAMPALATPVEFDTGHLMLSVQQSSLFGGSGWHLAAAGLWGVLLAWGTVAAWRRRSDAPVAVALIAAASQVAFHLVYGDQTFLYVLHFLPLLVLIACHSLMTSRASVARALLVATVLVTAFNNAAAVTAAARTLDRIAVPDVTAPASLSEPHR